ncbi:MAG: class I SAM-dependent methyltransferase [Patescibacteria group bacterium]
MKTNLLSLLKKIPLDLGQGNLRHSTKGKEIALSLIDIDARGKTALDVGCRDGYFSEFLKRRGFTVTSIDIESNYPAVKIVDANQLLPFDDNYFDLIWCSEVIEHLENPRAVINEFKRVLKPTGQAIFTTPNSDFWLYRLLKPFGLTAQKLQNPTHRHFFGLRDIRIFKPEVIYGFFPYMIIKFRITRGINFLSPTFIFTIKK